MEQDEPNGHGSNAAPDNKMRHARFPHPNPDGAISHSTKPASGQVAGYLPQAGEGANESLREFYVNGHGTHNTPRGFNWILVAFLAIAAFYLFTEHRAHLLGALPFLLLLACPLMHLFMHHGHGAHGGQGENTERSEK